MGQVDSVLPTTGAGDNGSTCRPSPGGEINASLVLGRIACTASSPLLTHVDDETLRDQLLISTRRLFGLRPPVPHHGRHLAGSRP
jgi:hypothetical protein